MVSSQGILTVRGGMTSHAAVVARGMGTCCVSGCSEIKMRDHALNWAARPTPRRLDLPGRLHRKIYGEAIPTVEATISGDFGRFMAWADAARKLTVRTNADNPRDAEQAVKFGAEGIGLCRTEHMFFEGDRIRAMREMIVAKTVEARKMALNKLLPYQQSDFEAMYRVLEGRPMTVRYLDPPLHEFLPTREEDIEDLAKEMKISVTNSRRLWTACMSSTR